jgi:hypothetical protein
MTSDTEMAAAGERGEDNDLASLLSSFAALLPIEHAAASSLVAPFDVETLVASSRRAMELDEAQIDLGEGPAWDALHTRKLVQMRFSDADAGAVWPFLSASAAVSGLAHVLALPLTFGLLDIGAVTLSSAAPVDLSDDQLNLATTVATVFSRVVVTRALTEAESGEVVRDPSLSRREVHQATGMVLAQMGASPGDALLAIRAHAYSQGLSVRSVAADIVARRLDFTPARPDHRK